MHTNRNFGYVILALAGVMFAACNKPAANPPAVVDHDHEHGDHDHDHADEGPGGHSLGGWWCNDHGVPEDICALCNTKLVAEFKAKGDWCEKHNRPDSQCFTCHPEIADTYAALYEAKAGKKPPKPTANGG